MSKWFVLGIDLGTKLGVVRLYEDGTLRPFSRLLVASLGERVRGVAQEIKKHSSADCVGVVIEQPFGANPQALQQLYGMMGAAVLACEENGLPWSLVHLSKIKKHATGKGNAKKPEVVQAAYERWGMSLTEDEADAAFAAAYGMDTGLFTD